jgi:hypothetical protein
MGKNLTSQNDQSNGPYYVNKKKPSSSQWTCRYQLVQNNGMVFFMPIQIGFFLLDLLVKKYHVF